jgi:hypothetical protein
MHDMSCIEKGSKRFVVIEYSLLKFEYCIGGIRDDFFIVFKLFILFEVGARVQNTRAK